MIILNFHLKNPRFLEITKNVRPICCEKVTVAQKTHFDPLKAS